MGQIILYSILAIVGVIFLIYCILKFILRFIGWLIAKGIDQKYSNLPDYPEDSNDNFWSTKDLEIEKNKDSE